MRARYFTLIAAGAALALSGCAGGGADAPEEDAAPAQVATEDAPVEPSGEGDGIFEASAPTAHEACMLYFRHDWRDSDRDTEMDNLMGSSLRAAKLAHQSPIAQFRDAVNDDSAEIGMYLPKNPEFIEVCEDNGYEAVEGSNVWFIEETAAGRPPGDSVS